MIQARRILRYDSRTVSLQAKQSQDLRIAQHALATIMKPPHSPNGGVTEHTF